MIPERCVSTASPVGRMYIREIWSLGGRAYRRCYFLGILALQVGTELCKCTEAMACSENVI
jgi:hypothetical protein